WLYWEGACPDWITACQRTAFAHWRDVRLLNWEAFERLWDTDRDLAIGGLQVAHRADFIRAFLLARPRGVWIDSDCLVVRNLQPVFDLLDTFDFIGHAERQGHISNGFMGARSNSVIANNYYRRVCDLLRSNQPLQWLTLGADTLTATLNDSSVPWYRLGYELIQPVCWSNPDAFFRLADEDEHTRVFNERSFCYMLSNSTVRAYMANHPEQSLLSEKTFFRYVLDRATEPERSVKPARRSSVGSSNWQQIPFAVEALLELAPLRVLDLGVGFGRWGV